MVTLTNIFEICSHQKYFKIKFHYILTPCDKRKY